MYDNKLYIPLRGVFEELRGTVQWDGNTQKVTIKSDGKEIVLRVGSNEVSVNGKGMLVQEKPRFVKDSIYVPLRFCGESLGAEVNWNPVTETASLTYGGKTVSVTPSKEKSTGGNIRQYNKKVANINANVIEIIPGTLKADLVLGQNRVGGTEEMASMALRSGALAAINGTYFEAYGGSPDPWNTLINKGKVIHIGGLGTVVGFTSSGTVKMAPLRIKIEGAINGSYQWPNYWYSYGFNHTTQGSDIFIHTPDRGSKVGYAAGTSVIVSGGKVIGKVHGEDATIPPDGFVIACNGAEERMADNFNIGDTVEYRVTYENTGGDDWKDVITAVGAGPRLVTNGSITVDPVGEGFTEAKITQNSGARSAIGVKSDGTILLVTVPGATVLQLASVMHQLGAYQAMNLDGGASSGLWLKGKYVTRPGRLLSNIIIFK